MAHTNAWGSKFDLARKKGQTSTTGSSFSNFGRSPFPIICTKIRAQSLIGSGEEDFLQVFTIYGHGSQFDQMTKST